MIRIVYKFFLSLIVLVLFFAAGCIAFILPASGQPARRKHLMHVAKWGCGSLLKILNIKVDIRNREIFDREKNWYIMGNHMSYIDILIILANFRTLFITSNEMKNKPILGQICFFGGSFFVERRKITTLKDEIPRISNTLRDGLNVCLFPEGRCSNGRGLLEFKSALIESAVSSGTNVLPVCIKYTEISGRPVKGEDFLTIGYFNGMPFPAQFRKMLRQSSLKVEIEILEPVMTEGKDRKAIREECFEKMNSCYNRYLEGRL